MYLSIINAKKVYLIFWFVQHNGCKGEHIKNVFRCFLAFYRILQRHHLRDASTKSKLTVCNCLYNVKVKENFLLIIIRGTTNLSYFIELNK